MRQLGVFDRPRVVRAEPGLNELASYDITAIMNAEKLGTFVLKSPVSVRS